MADIEVWFEAKVTIRSKMSLIREIKDKLTPAQTKIFRETYFGHWLDIKCDDNDPGYIHCLLMNQIDHPKNFAINGCEICEEPEELWFRVTRDHVIRCGRCEFCLVTGMRVSRGFFKDELKGTDKDKVIVAIALIINLCFLGKQLRDGVDDDMLLLIEDFDLMNKYLWGSFLWTKLYNSLHHVLVPYKERAADKTRKGVMTYHLSGFTWAFKDDIPTEERPRSRLRPTKTEAKCDWWVASVNYFKNPDAKVLVKKADDPKKFDDETKKELMDTIQNLTKRLDD
ncbi:uncharacterized protein [Rutidosis leptorrhynchoides]|uniref:uncharacterized protein n=1 Tax=Rutidosis leptorrhynchoides TaxID=125765 RepID=UPI003A9922C2